MPTVVMVGGGQLARMTHQAAIALGQSLRVLAASPDESAAQVARDVVLGRHDDLDALRKAASGSTVLTFDHEHVPPQHLETLISEGVNVQPPPAALIHAQDKLIMRRRLEAIGAPVPPFAEVQSVADAEKFAETHGYPFVLKATRGGYDGKGVWIVDNAAELEKLVTESLAAGTTLLAEEKVNMRRELSAMVARSPLGQGATWPVVETVQRNGVCAVVMAPAPALADSTAAQAQQLALRIAETLGVTGCLAVELFETEDGRILVNELAMRPHNSGHWTMDGAVTSQFEQHIRATLDYPLGDTSPTAPVTVMANILGADNPPTMSMDERVHHLCARMPEAKVHLYGKGERPGRKLGHVNVRGTGTGSHHDAEYVHQVREKAEMAAHWLIHAVWTDGWDPHSGH
ncbi:5-(carboxyamino)imidazole ribonucleotide synthase [Hoyosella rhizosphaerae]|uniref:N5-carboxyaminoimidazole ribonucleotide synthase n=2 Tax=Hoyosella rhizosphaerae TaxID=1755582 RepID=A0A916UBH6_9ACTN|nr:5-(carboxyamino)imidazole ribonucleotide synthase [Hoyosella rhizosphaerae]GGC66136.1 N5-carboxyaminoimidazole ribonucleotide synthase [Hoyosella rhizosphaerae]